jgi:hypothetical protein
MVARVQELGVKCDAGALTAEEIAEYRRLADLGTQRALERARQDRPVE